MSKKRYIDTKIWRDDFFEGINPQAKLLFIYFLTNEAVDLCGIYELSKKRISFETGIESEQLDGLIKGLETRCKVFFLDGWVVIPNFLKHQNPNDNVVKGMQRSFDQIPAKVWDKLNTLEGVSKPLKVYSTLLNLTLPNLSVTPNGDKSKTMYEEPIIQLDDKGEEIEVKEKLKTFGKYPQKIATYYCTLVGKTSGSRQLPASKELLQICQEQYPDDTTEEWYKEIVGRIKVANQYYEKVKKINDWNLSKVAENWDKILKEWSNQLNKYL